MLNFYFPTELLIEILLKLPVKSLVRFTSVCKSWQSLITSPIFISSHLSTISSHLSTISSHLSNTENHVILQRYENHNQRCRYSLLKVTENGFDSFSELEFPFKSKFQLVGSCHGLVCLWDYSKHVIIWNPSVKNYVVIPKPVFNPEIPHTFVLGFGVADHVYKVVRLVYYRDPKSSLLAVTPVAEVFSLSTGSWRRVEAFDVRLRISKPRQLFFKGVVHWLAFELTVDGHRRSSILTFEVDDEVFGEGMLPDELARLSVMELRTELSLFIIGESLGVGVIKAGNEGCDVWMMNEYGVKESWTELYTIDFGYQLYKVVGFCTSGEALCIVQGRRDELAVYIPKTRQIKYPGIYGYSWSFYCGNYVESLLLFRGCSSGAAKESSCLLNIKRKRCSI